MGQEIMITDQEQWKDYSISNQFSPHDSRSRQQQILLSVLTIFIQDY